MKNLIDYLDLCSIAYYNGIPLISDATFDILAESVGYSKLGTTPQGRTEKHFYPMYSLQKVYVGEDTHPLVDYAANEKDTTPKLDGAAISLLYVEGELVRALKRGDGIEGEPITDKLLSTNLVPLKINSKGILQITGEVCAPSYIKNARNYAAGALTLKDVAEFKTRAITFFAHGVYPQLSDKYIGDLKALQRLGFSTVIDKDITCVYPTDGVVFRVSDNAEFYNLGYTSKHPRGSYALKERSDGVDTTLLDVVWQVGKSGKITPVAILEPVLVGDAIVNRATLNNVGFIEALGLEIGDTVKIERAGEIIPRVMCKIDG